MNVLLAVDLSEWGCQIPQDEQAFQYELLNPALE